MRKPHQHPAGSRTPPGQRQLRVAEQIRHILVEILLRGRLRDPLLQDSSLITITAVEIGPDLKHATAFMMTLGGKNAEETLEALNRAAGFFRTELATRMDLRYIPKITFKLDYSFDEAEKIETLLKQEKVRRDIEKKEEE